MERRAPIKLPSPRYLALINEWPLRTIRSDRELDTATALARRLDFSADLHDDEREYLDVLLTLIERYEHEHYPIPDASDVDVLKMLIDSNRYTQNDVGAGTELAVSTISEILHGKRRMNRKHIEGFAQFFSVSPAVFLLDQE